MYNGTYVADAYDPFTGLVYIMLTCRDPKTCDTCRVNTLFPSSCKFCSKAKLVERIFTIDPFKDE